MSRFDKSPRDRSRSTRERRLKLYPFCAHCEAKGILTLTAIIDHKTPLAFGGEDTDENCQGLCVMCEAVKTASEQSSQQAASNHPAWLEYSISAVRLVVGPPCGGKSIYVSGDAKDGDLIIDLPDIARSLEPHWDGRWHSDLYNRCIRVRNSMLGSLARIPVRCCWFVTSAPSEGERAWWLAKLGPLSICTVVDPGMEAAVARAFKRDGRIDHVQAWYRSRSLPWTPDKVRKAPKVAFDADGYPVG